jgi:hypothetical protein
MSEDFASPLLMTGLSRFVSAAAFLSFYSAIYLFSQKQHNNSMIITIVAIPT